MPRIVTVAAAQLGPIPRNQSREDLVATRLVPMMEDAARTGADLVVYPEAALTAFFSCSSSSSGAPNMTIKPSPRNLSRVPL